MVSVPVGARDRAGASLGDRRTYPARAIGSRREGSGVTRATRESSHSVSQHPLASSGRPVLLRYSDRPRWHVALDAWAIAVLVAAAAQVLLNVGAYQWDVIVYWWGGHAFANGQSPYGAIPGQPVYLHYVYPPLTAALFAPLAQLNVAASKLIWIVLKAIALTLTVRLWLRAIKARVTVVPPIFFFTFAFGSALLVDFTSGNIAVFEQLALWLAFTALLARRPWTFALLVVVLAQFKLTPIFFLGVLLVIDDPAVVETVRRWYGVVCWAPRRQRAAASGADTRVPEQRVATRRARLGRPVDARRHAGSRRSTQRAQTSRSRWRWRTCSMPRWLRQVFVYTVRWWRAHCARAGAADRVAIILVTLAVYALVMPRMKDYSYVALLPVAWYALSQIDPANRTRSSIVAALVPRPLPQLKLLAADDHSGLRLRAAARRGGGVDGDHRRCAGTNGEGARRQLTGADRRVAGVALGAIHEARPPRSRLRRPGEDRRFGAD